jgi:preprotein translocase subunit SecA
MALRSDSELAGVRTHLSERQVVGHAGDLVLAEALAAAAEAARRATGYVCEERHLLAGAALYDGRAVDMADDGVNAVVSALGAFLAVVSGERVHLVAADEHLAARSFRHTERIYALLGVTCSIAPPDAAALEARQRAFDAEVIHGSYVQMAYPYLANHLAQDRRELVRWDPRLAVIDQVDAVLVDHAEDPVFISAPMQQDAEFLRQLATVAVELHRGGDYEIDDATGRVSWSSSALGRAAGLLRADSLEGLSTALTRRYLEDAVRAQSWCRRGADYSVDRERVIVASDRSPADSAQLRTGVLQAIEAREGLPISAGAMLLARITVRDYFRFYERLAGLSGEAARAAVQLEKLYQLKVTSVASGGASRLDHGDVLFDRADARLAGVVSDAVARHRTGQPVVVAVQSDDDARRAAQTLTKAGVRRLALVTGGGQAAGSAFANAGARGAVTVLGKRVPHGYDITVETSAVADGAAGPRLGLAVLVAGRGRSWRSDHWLQGLAGRRGDPGESKFYLSAEDHLLAGLQSRVMTWIPAAIRRRADGAALGAVAGRVIADVQRRAEAADFKSLQARLAFQETESAQRRETYQTRDRILQNSDPAVYIGNLIDHVAARYPQRYPDPDQLLKRLARLRPPELSDAEPAQSLATAQPADMEEMIKADLRSAYRKLQKLASPEAQRDLERQIILPVLGSNWRQQLLELEAMRQECGVSQRPSELLSEYETAATTKYRAMRDRVADETLAYLLYSDLAG